jgi:hypothetical protein
MKLVFSLLRASSCERKNEFVCLRMMLYEITSEFEHGLKFVCYLYVICDLASKLSQVTTDCKLHRRVQDVETT